MTMEDYPSLPVLTPSEALRVISSSPVSRAQKLLAASLVTEARIIPFRYPKSKKEILNIDVSHFLNHRINSKLINAIGEELGGQLSLFTPDLLLTAPSSGNFVALSTAMYLPNIPDVIYAPKGLPFSQNTAYQKKSRSFRHKKQVDVFIAADCVAPNSKVAICDDFLDTGTTVIELMDIMTQASCRTIAAFFVIEKPYIGRQKLIDVGIPSEAIISLIKIDAMRVGKIKIAGFDYWFELLRG
jgi:xanthine phosphoribosyltransferase